MRTGLEISVFFYTLTHWGLTVLYGSWPGAQCGRQCLFPWHWHPAKITDCPAHLVCFDQFSDRFSSKCGATYLNLGHKEANIFIFLRTPKNPTIIGAFVRNLWQNSPQNFPVLPPSAILFISGFCTCALRQQAVCCSSVSAKTLPRKSGQKSRKYDQNRPV